MKLALVGTTSSLSDNQERDMRQSIFLILKKYSVNDTIISGGAKGVDSIAIEIARNMGFETVLYTPEKEEWKYYKKRNLQIANICDELYCFSIPVKTQKCYQHGTPQNHEKTAGCYTAKRVAELDKPSHLIVSPNTS